MRAQNSDVHRLRVGFGCQNPPDGGGYEPQPQIARGPSRPDQITSGICIGPVTSYGPNVL